VALSPNWLTVLRFGLCTGRCVGCVDDLTSGLGIFRFY